MNEWNEWNKGVIEEFRLNDGKIANAGGRSLLLLHTIGAKSGLPRINPLTYYLIDGKRYLVVASKEGAPTNPDWYHNIIANPKVSVEVGTERFQTLATIVKEPERTQLFKHLATTNSFLTEHQNKTKRIIPIITLTRTS